MRKNLEVPLAARSSGKPVGEGPAPERARGAKDAADAASGRRVRAAQGGAMSGGEPRASLYDEVTARIMAELESGRIPWVQPWDSDRAKGAGDVPLALPVNALTDRAYSGVNVLILWLTARERGFAAHGWMTFRQALQAGGHVRKGEKGAAIVYADRFTPEAEKDRARDTGEEARQVAFLKRFTVFNLSQIEGLPEALCPAPAPLPRREIVPVAEALIAASGIDVRIGGAQAYYSPGNDFVQLPPQQAFRDQVNFYRTALHECCHATGHETRLNRNLANPFGSKDYAREELDAEMGSAFLCAALGIVPTVRHADYIAAWLEVLREDNRAIFRAASMASKAADWLLARHRAACRQSEPDRGPDSALDMPEDAGRATP